MGFLYPIEHFEILLDFIIICMNAIMLALLFKWRTDIIDRTSYKLDKVTGHYNTENKNKLSDVTDSLRQLTDQWDSKDADSVDSDTSSLLDDSMRKFH